MEQKESQIKRAMANFLFNAMRRLDSGELSIEKCQTLANMARQVNVALKIESAQTQVILLDETKKITDKKTQNHSGS
jgi:hypothetical protein